VSSAMLVTGSWNSSNRLKADENQHLNHVAETLCRQHDSIMRPPPPQKK
jgi:hypothetical protein